MPRFQPANYTDISIQLKPYLLKYVCHATEQNVLLIRPSTLFGNRIFGMLDFPPPGWRPVKIPKKNRLILRIPTSYIAKRKKGSYISNECKKEIAELVEVMYWQALYDFVTNKMQNYGGKELGWLRIFREQNFTYEEDYLEESAYKRYRRIKTSLQNRSIAAFR